MPGPVVQLPTTVCLAATFARLVAAVSIPMLLPADDLAAAWATVALAAITGDADSKDGPALRRATSPDSQDRFTLRSYGVHFGIMSNSMIGRMTLPSAG